MRPSNTKNPVTRRRRLGFTLVELLVVIAVIAVLIALLLPALKKAKESANRIVCQSNIRQLAAACIMYSHENKGYYPNARGYGDNPRLTQAAAGRYADWIKPEFNRRIEDSAIAKYVSSESDGARPLRKILVCPSDAGRRRLPPSYADVSGTYWPSYALHVDLKWVVQIRYEGRRHWVHKIMFAEVEEPLESVWNPTPQFFIGHERRNHWARLSIVHGTTFQPIIKKHVAGYASVAFFDGHVEAIDEWRASAPHFRRLEYPINRE